MSLIDDLCGYEKAKDTLAKMKATNEFHRNSKMCGFSYTENSIIELEQAILGYRREHNIFKVGDYIIVDSYKPEFQFYQLTQDDIGSHWINLVDYRHATPYEISQNRRCSHPLNNKKANGECGMCGLKVHQAVECEA